MITEQAQNFKKYRNKYLGDEGKLITEVAKNVNHRLKESMHSTILKLGSFDY